MQTSKRVLIVEDDPDLQAKFKSKVEGAGFEVDTASTKAEALEKVRCRTYHVAMVDIMLTKDTTDRGGIEVIKYINSLKEGTESIVWSQTSDVRVPVEALGDQKVFAYLVKKDIRSSKDYLVKVEEAYSKCQINSYGGFMSMIEYLASPEDMNFFEDRLMRLLGGGIDLVRTALSLVFVPLQPFLRKKNQMFSIEVDDKQSMAHELFWSKALGCAVYVNFGRKECEYVKPKDITLGEIIFEENEPRFKATVWRAIAKRDEFIETLYDISSEGKRD